MMLNSLKNFAKHSTNNKPFSFLVLSPVGLFQFCSTANKQLKKGFLTDMKKQKVLESKAKKSNKK